MEIPNGDDSYDSSPGDLEPVSEETKQALVDMMYTVTEYEMQRLERSNRSFGLPTRHTPSGADLIMPGDDTCKYGVFLEHPSDRNLRGKIGRINEYAKGPNERVFKRIIYRFSMSGDGTIEVEKHSTLIDLDTMRPHIESSIESARKGDASGTIEAIDKRLEIVKRYEHAEQEDRELNLAFVSQQEADELLVGLQAAELYR